MTKNKFRAWQEVELRLKDYEGGQEVYEALLDNIERRQPEVRAMKIQKGGE